MVIVEAIDFQQESGFASDEMAFYDFRYIPEGFHHFVVLICLRERNAHECAYVQSERLRFYKQAGAGDDAVILKPLDSLMDSSARHATLACDFQERHSGVINQEREDFLVDLINVITSHSLSDYN